MSKDKVGALVILVLSMAYGMMALNIPQPLGVVDSEVTPASLPIALSVTGIAVSLLILILPAKRESFTEAFKGLDFKRVGYIFLLMVGYGLTIEPLGFLISTILFLSGGFWAMGEGRVKIIVLVSITVSVVFWFILTQLLKIYLEPGILRFLGCVDFVPPRSAV